MYRGLWPANQLIRNSTCPLCGIAAFNKDSFGKVLQNVPNLVVVCPACGAFRLDAKTNALFKQSGYSQRPDRYKISFLVRSMSEQMFGSSDSDAYPLYTIDDFEKMFHRPDLSVQEKLHALLRFFASLSEYPGQRVKFEPQFDFPVLNAKNANEAVFYFGALEEQEFLSGGGLSGSELQQFQMRFGTEAGSAVTLTASGWMELDRLGQSGAESSNGFIAMSFKESRKPYDDAIDQAIRKAGYRPIHMARVEHLNRIDDEIIAQIRQSKFLVADFSLQSPGVYFEAGFMLGLGRPVIWLCDKAEKEHIHFDTRQYNIIDYINVDDLGRRLQNRIEATLGKGPHRG